MREVQSCAVVRQRGEDYLAEVVVAPLPTVLLLACADEDPLAGLGFSVLLHVEVGDVALACLWGREQAQVGAVAQLLPAGAAGRLAKDHNVLGHWSGKP